MNSLFYAKLAYTTRPWVKMTNSYKIFVFSRHKNILELYWTFIFDNMIKNGNLSCKQNKVLLLLFIRSHYLSFGVENKNTLKYIRKNRNTASFLSVFQWSRVDHKNVEILKRRDLKLNVLFYLKRAAGILIVRTETFWIPLLLSVSLIYAENLVSKR